MTSVLSRPAPAAPRERWSGARVLRLLGGRSGAVRRPVVFLVVAFVVATIASSRFATVANLKALLVSSSFLVIVAAGEAFVVLIGSIDLSVQSLLASSGMIIAWLTTLQHANVGLAVLATLAFGAGAGLLSGVLVAKARIPSFVVTLAGYWGYRGVALLINGGKYISPSSGLFSFSALAGNLAGISYFTIIALGVVVVAQLVLSYTPLGLRLRAVGSSEISAKRVGVHSQRGKIAVFMVSGFLAACAGIMITAWEVSIYPLTGQGYSLEAIAAVVLGGIPFTGGRGSVVGAALGALTLGIISDVIVLVALPSQYEYIFVALVLVVAGLQTRGSIFTK